MLNMRVLSLSVGALLSLNFQGVFADATCNTNHVLSGSETLSPFAEECVEQFCVSEFHATHPDSSATNRCHAIVLTAT